MGVQPGIGRAISIEIPRPPVQDQRAVARQLPEPLLAGRAALDVRDERAELVPVQLLLEEPREHPVVRADNHSGPPASTPLLRPASALRGGRIVGSDLGTPSDSQMTPRSWRRFRDCPVSTFERGTSVESGVQLPSTSPATILAPRGISRWIAVTRTIRNTAYRVRILHNSPAELTRL